MIRKEKEGKEGGCEEEGRRGEVKVGGRDQEKRTHCTEKHSPEAFRL